MIHSYSEYKIGDFIYDCIGVMNIHEICGVVNFKTNIIYIESLKDSPYGLIGVWKIKDRMKFELNDKEERRLKKFQEKHGKYSITFHPTGIGNKIVATSGKKSKDITDYGSW